MARDAFGNEVEERRRRRGLPRRRPRSRRAQALTTAVAFCVLVFGGLAVAHVAGVQLPRELRLPSAIALVVTSLAHFGLSLLRDDGPAPDNDEARPSRFSFGEGARDALPPERLPPPRA